MKKILTIAILFSLVVFSGCSNSHRNSSSGSVNNEKKPNSLEKNENNLTSSVYKEKNLNDLQKNGLEIIENQSFWVELEKWGRVKFISAQYPDGGTFKLRFYLVNDRGKILYSLPDFPGNKFWFFFELRAISFKDVNKDGLTDVIVIANYTSGAGQEGAIPFPVASIYFQKDKEFVNISDLDEKINDAQKNEDINMVLKFVEGKVPKSFK